MAGIFMYTLIGMVADLRHMLQQICAFGHQPFGQKMQGNHAANDDFDPLIDPCLGND